MIFKEKIFLCRLCSASILLLILLVVLCALPVSAVEKPSTVLAAYMIGSNLEYDEDLSSEDNMLRKEAVTKDITELLKGYARGSSDLEVVVAYGGSKKTGWDAMTIATIEDLSKDMENGVIGDSSGFYQNRKVLDMGSGDGVGTFLEFLGKKYPDSRIILIFSDHGFAYEGFGKDDNYEKSRIYPDMLAREFQKAGIKIDLVGFDACFMANLEFLKYIAPNTRYVVASEDTEPDHGWDYTYIISLLQQDPDITAKDLGMRIVDSYIENPNHQKGALSLSLLDLSRMDEVTASFETFTSALKRYAQEPDSYHAISEWLGKLSGIGTSKDNQGYIEKMVDLIALTQTAGTEISAVSDEAAALNEALSPPNGLVAYSRHDTPVYQIHGVGVFSPVMAKHDMFYGKITEESFLNISQGWIVLLNNVADMIKNDTIPPEVVKNGEGYSIVEDGYTLSTNVYYQIRPDSSMVVLGQEPLEMGSQDSFQETEWKGNGTYLTDSVTSSLLPVYYVETDEKGNQLYYAWGELNPGKGGRFVRMDIWLNSETSAVQWVMRPYSIDDEGREEFERSAATLYPGDVLVVGSQLIDKDGNSLGWTEIGRVIWSDEMSIQILPMPCGRYGTQIVAIDLAGNVGGSEITEQVINCSPQEKGFA
ncbi:MAG TPA: clostripain-related cysteine peptidase [Methanospirillum sp.]|nr:clostripain-related cysteine peptidase [Methanospirillum sp.]